MMHAPSLRVMSVPPSGTSIAHGIAEARARVLADDERLLGTQVALSEIPAPTGAEHARALYVQRRFTELGLGGVTIDSVGNVRGTRPGAADEPPIVVCAHLDTVFPAGTLVRVARDGATFVGPGIVDNARGVAAMLALAEVIDGQRLRTRRPILFVATVGEEGGGDLRGVKHLFASLRERPFACIALDGAGDDRIVHRALGSRRFRVSFRGDGGHSWAAFGVPNAVHAAGATAARLALLPLPRDPRTTLSVCRIGGGISVNTIPADAWLEVDLRSASSDVLQQCADEILAVVHGAVRDENRRRTPGTTPLTVTVESIGDRPSGELAADHPLVRCAEAATRAIDRRPALALASTDANVPLSLGIPAIAIGAGGRGGGIHTVAEWYDNTDGPRGVARALSVVVGAACLTHTP